MIKTDIILNGRFLELINDVSMPFTYQIADVKDPSKKNTNFSKTITLPGTRVNNEVFGWIWDTNVSINSSGSVNFTPSFNPNKKADVVILYDGAEIFKGFMKLDRIKVLSDYKIEYDVTCFGKLKDLFLEIGEKTLGELDLSKYNHNYTYDILKASWDNYIYKDGQVVPFNKGDGYVYPMVDYAMNNNFDWKVTHFYPCIYYKTIINEIITQAGFKYDGAIFNDNDFKSLVVNYGNGDLKLSTTQIDDRTFRASSTALQKYDVSFGAVIGTGGNNRTLQVNKINFTDDTTSPNFDPGNNYDTITSRYKAPFSGLFKFTASVDFSATHMPQNASSTFTLAIQKIGDLIIRRGIPTSVGGTTYTYIDINYLPVYVQAFNGNNQTPQNSLLMTFSTPITSGTTSLSINASNIVNVNLAKDDIIEATFSRTTGLVNASVFGLTGAQRNVYGDLVTSGSHMILNVEIGSNLKCELPLTSLAEGDLVQMSNILPPTIKQKDFLSSFFKLFNIYTETDKDELNYLHFESRPDFYATSGTIRNWDNKLDYSQNYEVIPMGDLDARTYMFKFKDDGDFWNDFYKKKYGETYGQKKFDIDNDWLNNTNLTEVIFSPTPLVDRVGDDKIIPRIFQLNNNGQAVPKISNLRLWYYGGVKTTANPYNIITSSGTTYQQTSYAYAGHLDDVQNPTFDVNFYLPIEVFYTATTYTNNNIFNKYYKQFINEITSKDSKIFKGQFHLNALDIALLNFRDLYYFHGDYWILNKIYDYNPIEQNKTTTCEFLKLKGGVPFIPTSGTTNGGNDVKFDNDVWPTYNDSIPRDGNIYNSDAVVTGSDVVVSESTQGAMINGKLVSVGGNTQLVTILSSSGTTVAGGVERVTVINSDNAIIDTTYTGKTVINGTIYGQKNIIWSNTTYTFDGTESGALGLFEIGGNVNVYLPYPSQIQNGYTIEIKNINNGGWKVTLIIQSDSISPTYPAIDSVNPTSFSINPGDHHNFTYYDEFWLIH